MKEMIQNKLYAKTEPGSGSDLLVLFWALAFAFRCILFFLLEDRTKRMKQMKLPVCWREFLRILTRSSPNVFCILNSCRLRAFVNVCRLGVFKVPVS